MNRSVRLIVVVCLLFVSVFIGCSNKPSSDELKQLNDLKAEVSSLEKEISAREAEKAALTHSIMEKDAQLKLAIQDRDALRTRVKGTN